MHLQNEVPAVGSAFWRSQLSANGTTWIRPTENEWGGMGERCCWVPLAMGRADFSAQLRRHSLPIVLHAPGQSWLHNADICARSVRSSYHGGMETSGGRMERALQKEEGDVEQMPGAGRAFGRAACVHACVQELRGFCWEKGAAPLPATQGASRPTATGAGLPCQEVTRFSKLPEGGQLCSQADAACLRGAHPPRGAAGGPLAATQPAQRVLWDTKQQSHRASACWGCAFRGNLHLLDSPNGSQTREPSAAARQPLGFALLQITHSPGRQGLCSLKTYPSVFIIETSCPIC